MPYQFDKRTLNKADKGAEKREAGYGEDSFTDIGSGTGGGRAV
jgi:hypothetical protein